MALLGIPVYALESVDTFVSVKTYEIVASYIFGYLITIWTSLFSVLWERQETLFALTYAQLDNDDEPEVRSKFEGISVRSIVDDHMNDVQSNDLVRSLKTIFNYIITIILLVASLSLTLVIFHFKREFYKDTKLGVVYFFDFDQLVWNLAEIFKIFLFDLIYFQVLQVMINWENHKYVSDHEKNFIYLGSFFFLVNTFTPIILIVYINSNYL